MLPTGEVHRTFDSDARAELGIYLRSVAEALAASDVTPEGVLRAAHARDVVRHGSDYVEFRVPDRRVAMASVPLSRASGDPHPESVEFRLDDRGAPVTLAELERVLGTWREGTPGSLSDAFPVDFTSTYPAGADRPRGPLTFVRASLSGPPGRAGVRVRTVLLRRFSLDP